MKETKPVGQKKAQPKNKKPGFFARLGKKLKEVFSEIKKVSWPDFKKVIKQTGVVFGVVIVFAVAIAIIDFGLGELLKLLTSIGG